MTNFDWLQAPGLQQAVLVSKRFLKAMYHDPKEIFKGVSEEQLKLWCERGYLIGHLYRVLHAERFKRTHPLKMIGLFKKVDNIIIELDDLDQEEQREFNELAQYRKGIITLGLPALIVMGGMVAVEYTDDKRWLIPTFLLMASMFIYFLNKYHHRQEYLFDKKYQLVGQLKTSPSAELNENDDQVRKMLRIV